jgi:hypothetical protein
MYKAKLKRLHLARPLYADTRLWTAEDIARADGERFEPNSMAQENSDRSNSAAPIRRLKAFAR